MSWTYERIAALAPDRATLDRAVAVAVLRKWRELGHHASLLWGRARSSGVTSYRAVLDLKKQRFYCSCPAAKTPCKHVLALLFLHLHEAGAFRSNAAAPDWVSQWYVQGEEEPMSAEEVAALNRKRRESRERARDQRLESMVAGAVDLEQWLCNLIQHGLAEARQQPGEYWEEMAARMVDAKLGSAGNRIRQWPAILQTDDWLDALLREIAELYLFVRGLQRLDQLPEALQQTLLATGGVNVKKESVLKGKGWHDHWLVAGQTQGNDGRLSWRRTWLLGEQSARQALLLDFSWGNQPFEEDWRVGAAIEATLFFYPGAYESRALATASQPCSKSFDAPAGTPHLEAFFDAYALAIGANPWRHVFPAYLDQVVPTWGGEQLLIVDQQQNMVPADTASHDDWRLIALSAGRPLGIFGEWNGKNLTVLSAIADGRLIRL